MKSHIIILVFLLITQAVYGQLLLVDPLEAIYPDANQTERYSSKWKGDYAQGGVASVHLLVKLPASQSFTLTASINDEILDPKVFDRLIDVPVEENTGLDSRTEQYTNQINPYVVRRAPFRIFEVIQPVTGSTFETTAEYSAFRFTLPSRYSGTSGTYKVNFQLTSEDLDLKGVFTSKVYPVALPKLSESNFFYTNWYNLTRMEEKHEVERWTEEWYLVLDKYAQMMAHGRQNSITLPRELITVTEGEISLDEERMLQFIDIFRKHGFRYFEAPHLMNRGDNDDWGDPELKVEFTKKRYYTEGGKEDIEKLMTLIRDFAVRNNLTENWLQHIADEPTSVNAQCYQDVVKQVREIYPEIRIMEATNDRDGLSGAIDIWCPLINDFQENEAFFREREKLGESVLVYTCLIPGGKWLNRTLDMERLRQVYFGWGAAFYNTGGYLHWGLNQYHADPFEQSVVKHPSPVAGPTNFLPAGDTHILYPGEDGPLSSIRFEAHRVGAEDYDLLQKLKTSDPGLHDKLVSKLFTSYTEYNLDLKDYRKTKRKLLSSL